MCSDCVIVPLSFARRAIMSRISLDSIFVPPNCGLEHRRAGHRFVAFLPPGEHDDHGKNSRSVSYNRAATDDAVGSHHRTERRAMLMAASWACEYLLAEYRGLPEEWKERAEECVGVEMSLAPSADN